MQSPECTFFGRILRYFVLLPASDRRNKARSEAKQLELLKHHSADLIVLARYMQILSASFVAKIPAGDYQPASLVFTGLHRSKTLLWRLCPWDKTD